MTQGQIEAAISEAVIRYEKEYMGRGPVEARTYLLDDMILVRLKGVLTKAEHQLTRTCDETKGRDLIKQERKTLIEEGRQVLENAITEIFACEIISMHTDISTRTGERMILFTLGKPIDFEQINHS